MKKFLVLGLMMALVGTALGQKIPPANWNHSLNKSEVKVGEEVEVIFKTVVPKGYHIYSNDYGDCPPVKAKFIWDKDASYQLVGSAKAIGSHHYEDDIFECEVADFEGQAEFRQKIKIQSANPKMTGILEYQMCTDDGMCVLFEYEYDIKVSVLGESSTPKVETPKVETKKDPYSRTRDF